MALALKALICLSERHADSAKLVPAKVRFFKHWLSLSEEQRAKEFGDDRLYQASLLEIKALGLPSKIEEVEGTIVKQMKESAGKQIEHASEYIKLRNKVLPNAAENAGQYQEIAASAIAKDEKRADKVKAAENLLRRVIKSGSDGQAFKSKA